MDSVNLIIKGDSSRNFDGKFEAIFKEKSGTSHSLYFDLDDWVDADKHGIFGGNAFVIQDDTFPIHVTFDKEVVLETDVGRAVYQTLFTHGWKENKNA